MKKETIEILRRRGVSGEDIKTADTLYKCIAYLDQKIFPGNHIHVVIHPRKGWRPCMRGIIADYRYTRGDDKKPAVYDIYAVGLTERVMHFSQRHTISINKNKKRRLKGDKVVEPTIIEICFMLAAHEVRHRVQRELMVRQFSAYYAKKFYKRWYSRKMTYNSVLAGSLYGLVLYFRYRKRELRGRKKSKKYIAKAMSRLEFDAAAVSCFLMNRWRMCSRLTHRETVRVMRMKPPKIV